MSEGQWSCECGATSLENVDAIPIRMVRVDGVCHRTPNGGGCNVAAEPLRAIDPHAIISALRDHCESVLANARVNYEEDNYDAGQASVASDVLDLITPLLEPGGDLISRKELLEEIAATRPHRQASWLIFSEIVKDLATSDESKQGHAIRVEVDVELPTGTAELRVGNFGFGRIVNIPATPLPEPRLTKEAEVLKAIVAHIFINDGDDVEDFYVTDIDGFVEDVRVAQAILASPLDTKEGR